MRILASLLLSIEVAPQLDWLVDIPRAIPLHFDPFLNPLQKKYANAIIEAGIVIGQTSEQTTIDINILRSTSAFEMRVEIK